MFQSARVFRGYLLDARRLAKAYLLLFQPCNRGFLSQSCLRFLGLVTLFGDVTVLRNM